MTANPSYPEQKRGRAGLALLLILAAHLVLLWFGLARTAHKEKSGNDHALLVWALPTPAPKARALPPSPAPAAIKPAPVPKTTSARMIMKPIAPTPILPNTQTAPSDSIINPTHPISNSTATPKSPLPGLSTVELAKISKEMEKDVAPNHIVQKYRADDTKLGQGIKAAYRGGGTTTTTITLPDGRVLTKVVGPGGTYCASKDSVGATAGRDQIKDGVRDHMKLSVTGDCPR